MADIDITATGSSTTIDGVVFRAVTSINAGTGVYDTFLAISDNDGNELGFNSDDTPPIDGSNLNIDQAKTHTVLLANVPITVIGGVEYYEIRLDINDANSGVNALISLDAFKIFSSASSAIESVTTLNSQNLVFDLDAASSGGNNTLLLSDAQSAGSGNDDYSFLIPVSKFGGADPTTTYLYLYAEMGFKGGDYVAGSTFEEFDLQNAVTLTGTKFNDLDGDGARDANEGPIEGVKIFIDANSNGTWEAGERFTFTDQDGNYTFYGIAAGTYRIDEVKPAEWIQTTGDFETITISDAQAKTHGTYVIDPIGNHLPIPHITLTKDASGYGDCADTVGETIKYTIVVDNDGELNLNTVVLKDNFEGGGDVTLVVTGDTVIANGVLDLGEVWLSGDANSNGIMETTETWTYTYLREVTQSLLDSNGNGDGALTNTATVTANSANGSVNAHDDATVDVCPNPDFTAVKEIVSVNDTSDWGATGQIDSVGDSITYKIVITNTGNVSLSLVSVLDSFDGGANASIVASMTESGPDDNVLQVGETWTYQWTETFDQSEIDAQCATDETVTNTLAATFKYDPAGTADDFQATHGNTVTTPVDCNPGFTAVKEIVSVNDTADWGGTGQIDSAGDSITYKITITNTGNVTLSLGEVLDTYEGIPADIAAQMVESITNNNVLEVNETWTYQWTETYDQADVDALCSGDGEITNTLAATFLAPDGESITHGNTVTTPTVCDPSFTALKSIVSVQGGVELVGGDPNTSADDAIDGAGDSITYKIVITNTGNVTLSLGSVIDTYEGLPSSVVNAMTESVSDDNVLQVGETWTYQWTETVDQDEFDAVCAGDEKITNTLAATFNAPDGEVLGPLGNSVNTTVLCAPAIDLEKYVSVDSTNGVNGTFDDADSAQGLQAVNLLSDVWFKVTLDNTGNVTLKGVDVVDVNTSNGQAGVSFDLMVDGHLTANAVTNFSASLAGDTDSDHELDVNEVWTITYKQPFDSGQHVNTATVVTDEGVTDSDDAYYYSLSDCGPGVGTPGFWKNLGSQFWDGTIGNETKVGANFPTGELTITYNGEKGLLLGDYNMNGIADEGNNLFVSLLDAQKLIDASAKQQQDGKWMLGRDVIATWLNYLAGNNIDSGDNTTPGFHDPYSPKAYLDDAIDWLKKFGDLDHDGKLDAYNSPTFTAKVNAIPTSSQLWSSAANDTVTGNVYSASQAHTALDQYNNDGTVWNPVTKEYTEFACDREDTTEMHAVTLYMSEQHTQDLAATQQVLVA